MKKASFPPDLIQAIGILWGAFALRALGLEQIGSLLGYAVMLYTPLWLENQGKLTTDNLGLGTDWQKPALAGFAAGIIICLLFAGVWKITGGKFPWVGEFGNPDFSRLLTTGAIAMVLFYPAAEELFFRGYIQHRLTEGGFSTTTILALQASLFAATHLVSHLNPAALLTFFPGLVMGLLRQRERNLAASFTFHAIANAFVVIW